MTAWLREWLLGVVAAAMGVSLAQALTPQGTVKRVGRLVGGLVLLLAMLRPLTAGLPGLPAAEAVLDLGAAHSLEDLEEDALSDIIAQRTRAYIVDKGRALGMDCQVRVTVAPDENGWPVPWEIQVTGTWTGEGKEILARLLREELGVPEERQSFWEVKG